MSRVPAEDPSWAADCDPEKTARELREQLAAAKARMREHRDQMHAAGLTASPDPAETQQP